MPTTVTGGNQDLQRRVTYGTPWGHACDHLLYGKARSENASICPRCYRKEQLGFMACYKCGVTITNVPISAEHVKAMAADAATHLLQSLRLRIRQPTVDDDPRRYRGVKKSVMLGKTWEQRCKGWRHGTNNERGPNGEFLHRGAGNPITMRGDADGSFKESCSQESRKEFGIEFAREMASQADELARHEEQMSAFRAVEHAMPSWQRQERYNTPLVRSAQAGGSGTRRRAGTEDEARAYAAVKGKGRGKNPSKDKARGKQQTWNI